MGFHQVNGVSALHGASSFDFCNRIRKGHFRCNLDINIQQALQCLLAQCLKKKKVQYNVFLAPPH